MQDGHSVGCLVDAEHGEQQQLGIQDGGTIVQVFCWHVVQGVIGVSGVVHLHEVVSDGESVACGGKGSQVWG